MNVVWRNFDADIKTVFQKIKQQHFKFFSLNVVALLYLNYKAEMDPGRIQPSEMLLSVTKAIGTRLHRSLS